MSEKKTELKICGLMREEDVRECCQLGVDICGFVAGYPINVPWNLTEVQCGKAMERITSPAKSCLVTGGAKEKIVALGKALRPDYIQLHYKETLEDVKEIVQVLSLYGIKVIKTVPASGKERYAQLGTYKLKESVEELCGAGVAILLVDSRSAENAGNAGMMANLSLYRKVKEFSTCPVMLGGGITSENCGKILREAEPDIVDVMTGVERMPGEKSWELLKCLVDEIEMFSKV